MTSPEINKPNNVPYYLQNLQIFFREYLSCDLFKSSEILKSVPRCYYGNVFRQFINISYFTVVIPVLILIVLTVITFILIIIKSVSCCLKPPQPLTLLKKPDRVEIKLTEEQTELLIESLKQLPADIFESKCHRCHSELDSSDIEWLSENGVFRHRKIPGLIFRFPCKRLKSSSRVEIKNMFDFTNKCWQICQDNHLDLLEVPNVGKACLGSIHDKRRYILISEELDFQPDFEDQFILRQNLSKDPNSSRLLQKVEEQIIDLVVASGYSDVKYDNIPILNRKLKKDPLKAAIIDFDNYKFNVESSFLGLLESYALYKPGHGLIAMIHNKVAIQHLINKAHNLWGKDKKSIQELKKAFAVKSELKFIYKKQGRLHKKKGFQTGREPFDLGIITQEDFKGCVDSQLGYEVAQEILNYLNSHVKSSHDKSKIFIRQACATTSLSFKVNKAFMKDIVKGFEPKDHMEAFEGSLLKQVFDVLIKKEIIVACKYLKNESLRIWF